MEGYYGYRFFLLALILVVNAFFAAAEVALVSVRPSRLRELAEEGHTGAEIALQLLANSERLLSVTQVGVTLASLGLGWAGEDTIFTLLVSALNPVITPATEKVFHGVAFGVSFLMMTYAHVVIGEVVPKNLAIEKADRLAVLLSPVVMVFYRVVEPFVYVIERSAALISRLLGLKGEQLGGGHSAEELKFIVSSSRHEGALPQFQVEAINRLLDLEKYVAREIMVPRHDITSIPLNATLDQVLRVFSESQYSRLPVYDRRPEQIVGYLHSKDMLRVWQDRRKSNERRKPVPPWEMGRYLREMRVAPETKPLAQLLDEFRSTHAHMAAVVDEFGTITGIVTLEDVLEQVFGEIEDEHDIRRQQPSLEAREVELEGTISIVDLTAQYGIELPADAGFETLAGFLLYHLGYIPRAGEMLEHSNRRFTILEMEHHRIARVRIEKLDQ